MIVSLFNDHRTKKQMFGRVKRRNDPGKRVALESIAKGNGTLVDNIEYLKLTSALAEIIKAECPVEDPDIIR